MINIPFLFKNNVNSVLKAPGTESSHEADIIGYRVFHARRGSLQNENQIIFDRDVSPKPDDDVI